MNHLPTAPTVLGLVVIMLLSLVLWGVQRGHQPQGGISLGDDWTAGMLVGLLVLAAFVVGAFVSYVLVRP